PLAELGVGEADFPLPRAVPAHERGAPSAVGDGLVKAVDGQPVEPEPARSGDALVRQMDLERHGGLSRMARSCWWRPIPHSTPACVALPTHRAARWDHTGLIRE